MGTVNRQWLFTARPQGLVRPEHFTWTTAPVPGLSGGEVLVRTLYLSVDPTQRNWFNPNGSTMPALALGDPMPAFGVGEIVRSRHERFQTGDIVAGLLGWQDYITQRPAEPPALRPVPRHEPLTWPLSLYGLTSLTAYFGMIDIGAVKPGDTVLVSGAAGATGSAAGQIARLKGAAKLVGIAGGPAKCAWLRVQGFDGAIDYKNEDLDRCVRQACPQGVDVFFDNVGGPALDAALGNLAMGARVVICGAISTGYTSLKTRQPLRRSDCRTRRLASCRTVSNRRTPHRRSRTCPEALQSLFTGNTRRKTIVNVADRGQNT